MLNFLKNLFKKKEAIILPHENPISLIDDTWIFKNKVCYLHPYSSIEIDSLYGDIGFYCERIVAMIIIIKKKGVLNNYVMQCSSSQKVKLNTWLVSSGIYLSDPLDTYLEFKKLISELKEVRSTESNPHNLRNIDLVINNADNLINVFNTIGEQK